MMTEKKDEVENGEEGKSSARRKKGMLLSGKQLQMFINKMQEKQ